MRGQRYETAPLDCWEKGKEMRRDHFQEIWTARDRGVPLVIGLGEMFQPLLCGLGEYADMGYGTKLPFIMRHRTWAPSAWRPGKPGASLGTAAA